MSIFNSAGSFNSPFTFRFKFLFVSISFLFVFILSSNISIADNHGGKNAVNSIIGDESFISKFGMKPDKNTDENLRVRTHLEYVEKLLRAKSTGSLNLELRKKKERIMNLLHEYINRGLFPKNYAYKEERRPCFIDGKGTICAVGFLIEQTAGKELAEKINNEFQYDFLSDIKDPDLADWVKNSGLTTEECAMIQPTYGFENPSYITSTYALSTAGLTGLNLTMSTLNVMDLAGKNHSKLLSITGMVTGAAQIAVGMLNFEELNIYGQSNEEKKWSLF